MVDLDRLINDIFFKQNQKKKADIDFGNYTLNEKENLIKDLLRKQVEIAKRL